MAVERCLRLDAGTCCMRFLQECFFSYAYVSLSDVMIKRRNGRTFTIQQKPEVPVDPISWPLTFSGVPQSEEGSNGGGERTHTDVACPLSDIKG
jgi:hypothetical protein